MMRMRMIAPILAVMLVSPAFAEETFMSAFTYLRAKDDPANKAASVSIDTYLGGVSETLKFVNQKLERENKPLLYCVVGGIEVEMLKKAIDKFFAADAAFPETSMTDDFKKILPIALVVLQQLPKEFPCK